MKEAQPIMNNVNDLAAPESPAQTMRAILETIVKLIDSGVPSSLILDENSPTLDAIRDVLEQPAEQPVGSALTDEQIDAALEAWFENGPVGIEHKTDRARMRAALAAAKAQGEQS